MSAEAGDGRLAWVCGAPNGVEKFLICLPDGSCLHVQCQIDCHISGSGRNVPTSDWQGLGFFLVFFFLLFSITWGMVHFLRSCWHILHKFPATTVV